MIADFGIRLPAVRPRLTFLRILVSITMESSTLISMTIANTSPKRTYATWRHRVTTFTKTMSPVQREGHIGRSLRSRREIIVLSCTRGMLVSLRMIHHWREQLYCWRETKRTTRVLSWWMECLAIINQIVRFGVD